MPYAIPSQGYLTHFLFTGRRETPFSCTLRDDDQLRLEKRMRALAAQHAPFTPPQAIAVGSPSPLGLPWRYYYSHGNIFVNDSAFYPELCRVELHAATVLAAPNAMTVRARLWSYCAVDLWLNGQPAACIGKPVYKPIQSRVCTLALQPGANLLYFRLETLGVRDTRTLFAFQLLEGTQLLQSDLPNPEGCAPYAAAAALLDAAVLDGSRLCLPAPLPQGATLRYLTGERDFRKRDARFRLADAGGLSVVPLQPYAVFQLELPVGDARLCRSFERPELEGPARPAAPAQPGRRDLLEQIAAVASVARSETDGFALYPMLARRALGLCPGADHEELRTSLRQIERRLDCADFLCCALVRLIREYGIPAGLAPELRRVMLGFRYWMDEPGQDGMCFWSENHTLMFFQTAYFFGGLYPDETFARSGKTGAMLRAQARERLLEWLQDVNAVGFEEFNSSVYSPITFSALLNLVDYAEPALAAQAAAACDQLLRQMALHCFHGVMIAPMGRAYRGVLTPWRECAQGLVHWFAPDAPYSYNEWVAPLATSRYRPPADLRTQMDATGAFCYRTGNAVVDLYKTADYLLTSVQCPRRDGRSRVWPATPEAGGTFARVKALNERFHGTTQFEPGVHGYQQHLWYAALAADLVVFANHPGQSCEAHGEMRPGYWHGNGVLPALRQQGSLLAAVYCIPQDHPIQFVHLFWDTAKFDETLYENGWLLGRRGDAYLGVWCSAPLVPHDDMLFGCERRAYAPRTGWLAVCGSRREHGSFAAFCAQCAARPVAFFQGGAILACGEFSLAFTAHQNQTQIVE